MIAPLGLVLSAIRTFVAFMKLARSGARLRLHMLYRWVDENGKGRSLGPGFDPSMHPPYDLVDPSKPGWAIAVEVHNSGQSPITITSWHLSAKGQLNSRQDGFSGNPELPTKLEPEDVIFLADTPNRFLPLSHSDPPTRVQASVTVRKGSREVQRFSKKALAVPKPKMTPRDLLESIRAAI